MLPALNVRVGLKVPPVELNKKATVPLAVIVSEVGVEVEVDVVVMVVDDDVDVGGILVLLLEEARDVGVGNNGVVLGPTTRKVPVIGK